MYETKTMSKSKTVQDIIKEKGGPIALAAYLSDLVKQIHNTVESMDFFNSLYIKEIMLNEAYLELAKECNLTGKDFIQNCETLYSLRDRHMLLLEKLL